MPTTSISTPKGKLYSDKYEYLDITYERFSRERRFPSKDRIFYYRQLKQIGFAPKENDYLETVWKDLDRDFISYKTYLEKYPEMERIVLPKYWAESYIKLWDRVAPFDKPNDVISTDILTFDSFVRAKLNRDVPCEPMIKDKIDALYMLCWGWNKLQPKLHS